MVGSVVGMQQIIITVGFLGVMVALLIVLKLKGGGLRRSLHQGKRIAVIEESAISPTEKMRLVSIDNREFVVLTSKGVQPVLTELGSTSISAQPASPAHSESKSASEESAAPHFVNTVELKTKRTIVINTKVGAHIAIKCELTGVTTYSHIKDCALYVASRYTTTFPPLFD